MVTKSSPITRIRSGRRSTIVAILALAIGLSGLNAPVAHAQSATPTRFDISQASTPARPLDASGCTYPNPAIAVCIFVKGSNNWVPYVYTEKKYTFAYINACDSVSLLVNGRVYLSSGRWCSDAGYYLSHQFTLNENFSDGDQICVRWDSYPNNLPCKYVY